MPVAAADLIYPVGELRAEWFPGEDLPANLDLWISAGEANAPTGSTVAQVDAVSKAYAYATGYESVLLRLAHDPNASGLDGGSISESYAKDQRDRFATKAAFWADQYSSTLGAASTVAVVTDSPARTSGSVTAMIGF